MKVEIEIDEARVKQALDAQVDAAISQLVGRYGTQDDVTKSVRKYWDSMIDERIRMRLSDPIEMTKMIDAAVEAKVKSQLNKLLKAAQ